MTRTRRGGLATAGIVLAILSSTGCSAITTGLGPPTTRPGTPTTGGSGGAFIAGSPTKATGCHQRGANPDPDCTPGALNPAVTQATIHQTICGVSGFTKTIRPPVNESTRLKRLAAQAYGITDSLTGYEGDHLISLELGGAADDLANFWDEPHQLADPGDGGSFSKDKMENYLNRQICNGAVSLAEAQHEIATDWYGAWVAAGRPRG